MPILKLGSQGDSVLHWYDWAHKYASSYNYLLGKRDGYYGTHEAAFTSEMQRRLGVPITGEFGDLEASRTGYKWPNSTSNSTILYRKIWYYSFPGSGADWNVGPAFTVGEHCKNVLRINHQPVKFTKGGYLGLLGGDSKASYVEVTYDLYKSLEWLLNNNPDVKEAVAIRGIDLATGNAERPNARVELELEFGAYSQSEDGVEDALEILFGDGGFVIPATGETTQPGPFRHLRDRINFIHAFGNPSAQKGAKSLGGHVNKYGGIARKTRPEWLRKLIVNIFTVDDFYAEVSDNIRPIFYGEIIRAESELPYFVHLLKVALQVIPQWANLLGPLTGPLAPVIIAGAAGIPSLAPLLGGLIQQATTTAHEEVDKKLVQLLTARGIAENIPGLIQLVGALPGLQSHGMYHVPRPEFQNRSGIDLAIQHVNEYRRPVNV